MVGRDLLNKQLVWAIGNGLAVNIWNNPWLSSITQKLPFGPAVKETKDLTVSHLFVPNTTIWNREKIEHILPAHVSEILSIKPSQMGAPDKLVWLGKDTGKYTTRTCYFIAVERGKTEEEQQSTTSFNWISDVWRMNVSPKLKLFLWKSANKILPVGERLTDRHIPVNPQRKRCGEVETIPHMFFQCFFAEQVWRSAPFVGSLETGSWSEYEQTWGRIKDKTCLPPSGITKGPLSPWILWSIWVSRNRLIFEDKRSKPEDTITSAISMAREWLDAQQVTSPQKQSNTHQKHNTTVGVITCQTDAAWNVDTKSAGLSWLFLSQGTMALEQSITSSLVGSPIMAKALALREAIYDSLEKGYKKMRFESDSSQLINVVNSAFRS
ncbi:unnamed protein product [Arabis nemorensis]|uniref:Reverse transcriptase zinc-binding domain-containing protein n=1 Tax=Arabis nemorensis TaxID=586526 RepID=A0A565BSJ0_9BRAS|nr:unnamed protein product [Arabis nemorensis]